MKRIPLRRTVALRTYRNVDPVTAQVRAEVIWRDLLRAGGCVAPYLDPNAGLCRDRWGTPVRPDAAAALTVDHIREHPGGERRSVPRWLVTVCWGHHVNGGWATAHRPELRDYLGSLVPHG